MKKTILHLPEMKLVGITTRTSNADAFGCPPKDNPIAQTVQRYWHEGLAGRIENRKNPGTTLCVYTQYESDFTGKYTYWIGEKVTALGHVREGFQTLTIPPQTYIKFTDGPGPMPHVCIHAWQRIWGMDRATLGGERAYIADFEVYDARSHDPQNVTLDLYIGVRA